MILRNASQISLRAASPLGNWPRVLIILRGRVLFCASVANGKDAVYGPGLGLAGG